MSEDRSKPQTTLALSTKVEEDFVAPLTSLRGSLEILRDIPDLSEEERRRFLETALRGCNAKFERRFRWIERDYAARDENPAEAPLDELEEAWQRAKRAES